MKMMVWILVVEDFKTCLARSVVKLLLMEELKPFLVKLTVEIYSGGNIINYFDHLPEFPAHQEPHHHSCKEVEKK